MKEIDYIFENIDVKNFIRLIDKTNNRKGINITFEIFESIKKPNKKLSWLLDTLVTEGIFFNRVKGLSLIYRGSIDFVFKGDPNYQDDFSETGGLDSWSIICFYSNLDKKYRLLSFYWEERNHNDTYEVIKIYDEKPTIEVIKNEFRNFIDDFNSGKLDYWSLYVDNGYKIKLNISSDLPDSKSLLKNYEKELNLERK